jgi:hypothetical protein
MYTKQLHQNTTESREAVSRSQIDKVKVKISLLQAVEAHRVARGQGSHIT